MTRGGKGHILRRAGGEWLAHGSNHYAFMVEGGVPLMEAIFGQGQRSAGRGQRGQLDIVHVECEVLEVTTSRSRPDGGMVTMRCENA